MYSIVSSLLALNYSPYEGTEKLNRFVTPVGISAVSRLVINFLG